jgi:hypothetical protein
LDQSTSENEVKMDTLKDKLKSSETCYKQLADSIGNVSKEENDNQAKMIVLQRENAVLLKDNEKHLLEISLTSDKNQKLSYEYSQLISDSNKENDK